MFKLIPSSVLKTQRQSVVNVARWNSTTTTPPQTKRDPLATILNNVKSGKSQNTFKSDMSSFTGIGSKKNAVTPYETACNMPLAGQYAGRTLITSRMTTGMAIARFNTLVKSNRLHEIYNKQRFYTKPCKRLVEKRIANKKKRFDAGIANLFEVVKNAVRKGY
ncbi:unnamed protein product [Ambrosiozyma monospora]|uniref:Unnamed protein product n=1 Tax=Ambrosiozyma monospora TaxID=43982 RepID=A0ACB5STM3_AMBMO|nr:unnamed protein product [Ambrosiozyma monospora]